MFIRKCAIVVALVTLASAGNAAKPFVNDTPLPTLTGMTPALADDTTVFDCIQSNDADTCLKSYNYYTNKLQTFLQTHDVNTKNQHLKICTCAFNAATSEIQYAYLSRNHAVMQNAIHKHVKTLQKQCPEIRRAVDDLMAVATDSKL